MKACFVGFPPPFQTISHAIWSWHKSSLSQLSKVHCTLFFINWLLPLHAKVTSGYIAKVKCVWIVSSKFCIWLIMLRWVMLCKRIFIEHCYLLINININYLLTLYVAQFYNNKFVYFTLFCHLYIYVSFRCSNCFRIYLVYYSTVSWFKLFTALGLLPSACPNFFDTRIRGSSLFTYA